MNFKYKEQIKDACQRKRESGKILQKYPDRIPVICEKDPKSAVKAIDKTKYLVPRDLSVSQFSFIIRKRLEMNKESALFLLVAGKESISGETSMSVIYERFKDPEDEFLYISYTGELSWG